MKRLIDYDTKVRRIIESLEAVFVLNESVTREEYVTALGFLINKYKRKIRENKYIV